MKSHKKKSGVKDALRWTWEHTKLIVNILYILYIVNWIFSAVVIVVAIIRTSQFSYLDTLITETNETFRQIVGLTVVKSGVENVFKYNDFGGKGQKYTAAEENEQSNNEEAEG